MKSHSLSIRSISLHDRGSHVSSIFTWIVLINHQSDQTTVHRESNSMGGPTLCVQIRRGAEKRNGVLGVELDSPVAKATITKGTS